MIPDVHRIQDLTKALNRCRKQMAETENTNAREIYERVILRYETVIAGLSGPSDTDAGKTKPPS